MKKFWRSDVAIGFSDSIPSNATEITEEEYNTELDEIHAEMERRAEEWLKEHPEGSEEND